jgi:predicted transcriptional regulator
MLNPEDSNDADINITSSYADVIKSISDEKSVSIFKLIADTNSNGEISLKKSGLSSKQYHSRVSQMKATGLIKRKSGKYYLSSLGKVIYCCMMISQSAIKNYYKLKAIDSSKDYDLSAEEFRKLVDALIDNQKIKEFLINQC